MKSVWRRSVSSLVARKVYRAGILITTADKGWSIGDSNPRTPCCQANEAGLKTVRTPRCRSPDSVSISDSAPCVRHSPQPIAANRLDCYTPLLHEQRTQWLSRWPTIAQGPSSSRPVRVEVQEIAISSLENKAALDAALSWSASGADLERMGHHPADSRSPLSRSRIVSRRRPIPSPVWLPAGSLYHGARTGSAVPPRRQLLPRSHPARSEAGGFPVEQPTVFDLILNRTAAQRLGVTIPPDVAAQVTEWVQ